MAKMSDDDFIQLVKRRRDAALEHMDGPRKADRLEALQFYRGDNLSLYGTSGDGLSSVVSRDFMEAIESMLPGVVKPFIAGDETVRFEPKGPEDEEGAKQSTEFINYLFQNHNDAVRVVYDYAKDGMMFRLGVAKVVHEVVTDTETERLQGLSEIEKDAVEAMVAEDKALTISGDIAKDEETGLYDIILTKATERGMYRVYVISEDEFMFEPRLADMAEGRFFGHRATKPAGAFIAMGLPKAKVLKLKPEEGDTEEDNDRFHGEDDRVESDDDKDLARLVTVDECYILCDRNGTGTLGWWKVFIGANDDDLLLDEEAEDHPYETWTPIPLPHKLVGMSVFDVTKDIQIQKTALLREMMNATYLSNRPQREVVEGQVNMEDVLNPAIIGGVVRVKQTGMIQAIPSGGEGVIQTSLAMVEHLDGIREARTGATRYNQGMDANSLNKTATGVTLITNASQQRQELIARMLAEGMKGIFRKMLGLVARHTDKEQVIRLRGKWVKMDPREWKTGYDMSVAVGLGTGNRDQQVGQLMQMLEMDQTIIQLQGSADGPIVTLQNVYEKLKRLTEAMGMKGVESYYTDPSAEQEGEQQPAEEAAAPDPMAQFQAQAELEIEKARTKANADIEIAKIKAEADIIIAGMSQGVAPDPQLMDMEADMDPVQPQEQPEPMELPEPMPYAPDDAYMPQGEAGFEGDDFGGMLPPAELDGGMA